MAVRAGVLLFLLQKVINLLLFGCLYYTSAYYLMAGCHQQNNAVGATKPVQTKTRFDF